MTTLNLGILAHVDAGKTSLTERLLYAAGVIDEIGSVDDGSTQTDTLALERQRGITIKSAVASFAVGGVTVNLLDTPGHPDFIAEVERVLAVLDGAVLIVSAVEGVQAQTRLLARALRRLAIPTLIFVNKIDRAGADRGRTLRAISERLTPATVAMGATLDLGTRAAGFTPYDAGDADFTGRLTELLTEYDDGLLAQYVGGGGALSSQSLSAGLAAQSRQGLVHPVFFGSAITGAGVDCLIAGITRLLPAAGGDPDGPVDGGVFKIERGPAGEKVGYVRLRSGTLRTRDRLRFGPDGEAKVTAIEVFDGGPAAPRDSLDAGQIGKLWGLSDLRVGDVIGESRAAAGGRCFAPPTLETVIVPCRREDRGALHAALVQLAEQDPLIDLRQDDIRQELYLSLYGEVQKEVIAATLADEFGVEAEFRETTTICVERPAGSGTAAEFMGQAPNPFRAALGLRVDPAGVGSGVAFALQIESGALPSAFVKAVQDTVRQTLRQGLRGWPVTDCTVTMTQSGYVPPPPHGWSKWSTSAGDFRGLTPLVLMTALARAGTTVLEPVHRFLLEIPADTLGAVLPALARLRAFGQAQATRGSLCVLEGVVPAAQVHQLRQLLPGLTRGEALLECAFDSFQPAREPAPVRARSDWNPLNRKEYLLRAQGVTRST